LSRLDELIKNYESFVSLPWKQDLAGVERVWFAVYDPDEERRLRCRIEEFEISTKKAEHDWRLLNITDSFAIWMSENDYRESYFEEPADMLMALKEFETYVREIIRTLLADVESDENTVVAIHGVASLYGLTRVSSVIEGLEKDIRGRLLIFFPGEQEGNNYRLLGARDGWNYMAIPITAHDGGME